MEARHTHSTDSLAVEEGGLYSTYRVTVSSYKSRVTGRDYTREEQSPSIDLTKTDLHCFGLLPPITI